MAKYDTPRVGLVGTYMHLYFCAFKFIKVFGSPVSVSFIHCGWL